MTPAPCLHHAGLTVTSLDRALRFWRDALGMEEVMLQEAAGGYFAAIVGEPQAHVRMAHLAFGGDGPRIELFEFLAPPGAPVRPRPPDPGFAHVCVACRDLDQRLERLRAAGGAPVSTPVTVDRGANRGARAVYVRDPDGHVLELFEPAQGRTP